MKISDILQSGKVYTPVYEAEGNEFIIPIPENVYPTEEEARANAIGGGFEYMAQLQAGFTGETRALSDGKETDQDILDGLCVQAPGFYVIIIAGPLYERGKAMNRSETISVDFVNDVKAWMTPNED